MYSEIILSGWFNDYQGMQREKPQKIYFFTLDGLVEQFSMRKTGKSEKPLHGILLTEVCFTEDSLQYLPADG